MGYPYRFPGVAVFGEWFECLFSEDIFLAVVTEGRRIRA